VALQTALILGKNSSACRWQCNSQFSHFGASDHGSVSDCEVWHITLTAVEIAAASLTSQSVHQAATSLTARMVNFFWS